MDAPHKPVIYLRFTALVYSLFSNMSKHIIQSTDVSLRGLKNLSINSKMFDVFYRDMFFTFDFHIIIDASSKVATLSHSHPLLGRTASCVASILLSKTRISAE